MAAFSFNKINNINIAIANDLSQILVHVDRKKEYVRRPTNRHNTIIVRKNDIRTTR